MRQSRRIFCRYATYNRECRVRKVRTRVLSSRVTTCRHAMRSATTPCPERHGRACKRDGNDGGNCSVGEWCRVKNSRCFEIYTMRSRVRKTFNLGRYATESAEAFTLTSQPFSSDMPNLAATVCPLAGDSCPCSSCMASSYDLSAVFEPVTRPVPWLGLR